MTLPLGATWEQHLEWCEREIARLHMAGVRLPDGALLRTGATSNKLASVQAEAARCREEIIKAKGRER